MMRRFVARVGLWIAATCTAATLFLLIGHLTPTRADQDAMDQTSVSVSTITDLEDWFAWQQELFLPIIPPTVGPFVQSSSTDVLPFSPKKLPKEIRKNLPGTVVDDCPVYRVYLCEDPVTRARVLLNKDWEEVYSLPAEPDYNPFAFVEERHPDLYSGNYAPEEVDRLRAIYDPARIQIVLDLVPEDFYGSYIATQSLAAAPTISPASGGMTMKSSGGSCTQLCVSAVVGPADGSTNSVEISICVPTGLTNKVEVFAFDQHFAPYEGTDSVWLAVATGLQPASGTNIVVWTNTPLSEVAYKFYTAGSDLDEDGDGLSSAMETLTFNSSPSLVDSDLDGFVDGYDGLVSTNDYPGGFDLNGDGYVDGEAENRTDPTNADIISPSVVIDWPADGQQLVWVP